MSKLIAICTADWHLHKFQAFDVNGSRLAWALTAALEIIQVSKEKGVPILFTGDLIHSYKNIENETNALVQGLFEQHSRGKVNFLAISGNHDFSLRNGINNISPSHLDALHFPKFFKIDKQTKPYPIPGGWVWGIPYMNNDADLKTLVERLRPTVNQWGEGLKVLMIHSDLPGAKTSEGFVMGKVENIPSHLDKFFKEWDVVIAGHIHRPQQLSKKVYMLGCPIPQQEHSVHHEYGYWKLYSTGKMIFVNMPNYPRFIRLKKGESIPSDPGINYYIPYNDVLVEEDIKLGEFNINNSKTKLAKSYIALKQIKSKTKRQALIKILNDE